MDKKLISKPDIFLCLILAGAFAVSPGYIRTGKADLHPGVLLIFILLFLGFLTGAYLARKWIGKADGPSASEAFFLPLFKNKNRVLLLTLLIFLVWLPAIVCLYPGTAISDTWGELSQFFNMITGGVLNKGALTDHHPVFDTILFGITLFPLEKITGSWQIALFIFVMVQAVFTAAAFSCSIVFVYERLHLSRTAFAMLCLYCLLPFYPLSVQTVAKDSLFSWLFVFFCIRYLDIIIKDRITFRDIIIYTVLTVACCLTKKLGFYVVFLSTLGLLLIKKQKKLLAVPAAAMLLTMYLLLPLFLNFLGASRGGKQEMFSVPFQQTARCIVDHGDEISGEEYAVIRRVIDTDGIEKRYDPAFADPVKGYKQLGEDQDYIDYFFAWLKMGFRFFDSYVNAFQSMVSGWFSWTEYRPLISMSENEQIDYRFLPESAIIRPEFFRKTSEICGKIYDWLYRTVLLAPVLSYGMYASLIPAFVAASVSRAGGKKWVSLLPMLLSVVLGLWLAPASIHFEGLRYLYPLTYTMPLMLAWSIYIEKENVA